MATYRYAPLDSERKQIRLLSLLPGSFRSELKGRLRTVSLDEEPSYEALSYTWGASTEGRSITIDRSGKLALTDNLFRALRTLRYLFKVRVMWIDAICINQADLNERSAQVAFMGDIYSTADCVAIWLGGLPSRMESGHINRDFFNGMRDCYPWWHDSPRCRRWLELLTDRADQREMWFLLRRRLNLLESILEAATPRWDARAWTRQEVHLAKRAEVYFGPHKLRLRLIELLDLSVGGSVGPRASLLAKRLSTLQSLTEPTKTDWSLLDYFYRFPDSEATDPRDLVYSALSLINKNERQMLTPDYHASCADVFTRATFVALQGRRYYELLLCVTLFRTSEDPLPSWAVDFSSLRYLKQVNRNVQYNLSRGYTLSGRWGGKSDKAVVPSGMSLDCKLLTLAGVPLDSVTATVQLDRTWVYDPEDRNTADCDYHDSEHRRSPLPKPRPNDLVQEHRRALLLDLVKAIASDDLVRVSQQSTAGAEAQGLPSDNSLPEPWAAIWHTFCEVWDPFWDKESTVTDWGIISSSFKRRYAYYMSDSPVLFITSQGHRGLGTSAMQAGDSIVVPVLNTNDGNSAVVKAPFFQQPPLVLRSGGGMWVFRGAACVHGLEQIPLRGDTEQEYVLC